MEPNSQWLPHVSEIYGNQNIFPQDFPNHKQFDYNPASSVPLNPIQNTPPSSCLTTLDSSSITHELDNTSSILTSRYPNTPPYSSYLINQNIASSTPSRCSEILDVLNNRILNNSIPTYSPSINNSSTRFYSFSDGDWNGNELCMQQGMNFDPNLPNLLMNSDYGLRNSSECLSYQPWFRPSLFDLQQRLELLLESKFPYYGSPIIGSGLAENALAMEMGSQESLFDITTQSDQINKMTEDGIVDREFERRQVRKLKNRESAARSRVKKQEHLNYLEQKSWRLERENELLSKELVFLRSIPMPRIQLRRSSSCEFLENKTPF
ncbi:uncharacterized protein LOC110110500 [Dendrobium catenatum]|uniref:ABSCISIC ACID-INSENSITIVE 5-like protein 2 n=1 Tax=Dendrobium catenatum TaxID=906689 RepID=A0A2I0WDV0_9ASPA|nr:uncharacterized protein LOC110110500 [Dendrobium catenatum]PKU73838.1 ABSCISIC ACID-INSENSITIVE 5-like protein 2 [Dendrobium catenatum]